MVEYQAERKEQAMDTETKTTSEKKPDQTSKSSKGAKLTWTVPDHAPDVDYIVLLMEQRQVFM